mmetsp:Transcript_10641/g.26442  ORF Transcript_10641/g.26442 Transcript_10641/m.26442 type:complete len:717 (+) Transcript_10641:619-2769(+)
MLPTLIAITEGSSVLKELQPWRCLMDVPTRWHPRVLPFEEAALRVRHHRQVAAVLGAESGDSVWRPIRVVWVALRNRIAVVHVTDGGHALVNELLLQLWLREVRLALAVRHPYPHRASLHALEKHGRRGQDRHRREAGLEPARVVVHEARLLGRVEERLGRLARAWHPAEQCHQLAAVAHAEGEGVLPHVEGIELSGEVLLVLEHCGPPLGRVEDVAVREAAGEDDAAEAVERDALLHQVGHRHVPRLQPGGVQRRGHLAVTIGALLPQHCDWRASRRGERRGGLRRERELPHGRRARAQPRRLFLGALFLGLQLLQLGAGGLPRVAQVDHRRVEHHLARCLHLHALVARRRADPLTRDARGREGRLDCRCVGRGDLDDHARLLGEERCHHVGAGRHGQVEVKAAVAGEGHLEESDEDAAVAHVVAGEQAAAAQQRLHRLEGCRQLLGGLDVRGRVAQLAEDLREGRAAEAALALRRVDEVEDAVGTLQVGRDDECDVGARRVRRDHQRPRGLDRLVAHTRRHGEGVLAAIDRDADLAHEGGHGRACLVHRRALALELGGPHPVGGALDVAQRGDRRPHQVGERLAHGEARHRGGREQPLDRLLADGGGGARHALVRLRDHAHVGERRVERADALLLCDEPRDRAVDFVGEEALRADRREAQHAVERVRHLHRLRQHEGLEQRRHRLGVEGLGGQVAQHERERQVDGRQLLLLVDD